MIYSEARRQYDEAYQKAYQRALGHFKGDEMMAHLALYSSFGWDKEIFISKDFLDRVQIAGRRTFPTGALTSEGRQRKPDTDLSPLEAARRVSNTNPAAKLYLDLLVRLNRINLSKSEKDRYEVKETKQYLQEREHFHTRVKTAG